VSFILTLRSCFVAFFGAITLDRITLEKRAENYRPCGDVLFKLKIKNSVL
jgi:hypothetical protein